MNIKAKVISILPGNKYIAVDEQWCSYSAICLNSLKAGKIYVGDFVEIDKMSDTYIIKKLLNRKNYFIRPPVANIDVMVLCVSLDMPPPDFFLLDKQLALCMKSGTQPIICITKMDLLNEKNQQVVNYVKSVYGKLGFKIWHTSSVDDKNIYEHLELESNLTYAFSGNSGVGKSSMISLLTNEAVEIAEVAEKTNRGRHTTKYVKIYKLKNSAYIVDTPGFSSYDIIGIDKDELKDYYNEFKGCKCKYLDCSHIKESADECSVKKKVEQNEIDIGRYNRYSQLFEELKDMENFKYKR